MTLNLIHCLMTMMMMMMMMVMVMMMSERIWVMRKGKEWIKCEVRFYCLFVFREEKRCSLSLSLSLSWW